MIDENVMMIGLVVGMMMWDRLLRHRIEMTKLRNDNEPEIVTEIVEVPVEKIVEKVVEVPVVKENLPDFVQDAYDPIVNKK